MTQYVQRRGDDRAGLQRAAPLHANPGRVDQGRKEQSACERACTQLDEPESIDRVPQVPVNPLGDQFLLLHHLERRRPVAPQVYLRAPVDPYCQRDQENAQHAQRRRQRIIGEVQPA